MKRANEPPTPELPSPGEGDKSDDSEAHETRKNAMRKALKKRIFLTVFWNMFFLF